MIRSKTSARRAESIHAHVHHGSGEPQGSLYPAAEIGSRERWARVAAAAIFAIAVWITLRQSAAMPGSMPMPGGWRMTMMWMAMPGQSLIGSAWMFLAMWQAMMIAMMLPSAWPMLELYERVSASAGQARPLLAASLAGVGYFLVWLLFGAVAFALGMLFSQSVMHSAALSRLAPAGAGVALMGAGAFQLTEWKQVCLKHCRSPLFWLGDHWRPGPAGALRTGLIHGAACAACCWALMLIQLVLGVMNLGVMIAVAAAISVEKLWKHGPKFARISGACAAAAGAALFVTAVLRWGGA